MIAKAKCERCGAPIDHTDNGGSMHEKCRMLEQLDDESCTNCGGEDATFIMSEGNLLMYHEECGTAVLNPHED